MGAACPNWLPVFSCESEPEMSCTLQAQLAAKEEEIK